MRKTKINKRKIKYSKKTRKNKNLCKNSVTDEVLRLRGLIKELRIKNLKSKPLTKGKDASTKGRDASTKGSNDQ
jgi:hypothetical protein